MRLTLTLGLDDDALVAVANTRHGIEAWRPLPPPDRLLVDGVVDRLRTPRDAVAYLRALEIAIPSAVPTAEQLVRLRDVRECARTLAEGDRRGFTRRLTKLLGDVRVTVAADGALRTGAGGWDAFADALCLALVDLEQRRRRVRLCHNAACAWLFIDVTRNNSQVWCTAQLCGDRLRVRRARRRAAG